MPGLPLVPAPVRLLLAPYDSGHVDARMGSGPTALAGAGAAERLRRQGHVVTEQVVLRLAAERMPVVSATPASYDPAHDVEHRMRGTALALLDAVAANATPLEPAVSGGRA